MDSVMKIISKIDQTKNFQARIFEEFRSGALHEAKKDFQNLEMRRTRVSTVAYARTDDVLGFLKLEMNRNFSESFTIFLVVVDPGGCWGCMGKAAKGRA